MRVLFYCSIALLVVGLLYADQPDPKSGNQGAVFDHLYRIEISSRIEASLLVESGIDPVLKVGGGYLVLSDPERIDYLRASGLAVEFLSDNVYRQSLALDHRMDNYNRERFELLYEEDNLRLYRVEPALSKLKNDLLPLPSGNVRVAYSHPLTLPALDDFRNAGLDSLVAGINQDSLYSYVAYLQSLGPHYIQSYANRISKEWLLDKFTDMGYDSVITDTFTVDLEGQEKKGHNVIVTRVGTEFPHTQIIVGAHRDSDFDSPGADDNGSGVGAVIDMARILADIDTRCTIIFILFDAEEVGIHGSEYYAEQAFLRNDQIAFMFNMDMIAHVENDGEAKLYHSDDTSYARLWSDLAASLSGINITGHLAGYSAGSDHLPFFNRGYTTVFLHEYILSPYLHTPQDSTSYMNFEYMTRMTKTSLATIYAADSLMNVAPQILIFPDSQPGGIIRPGVTDQFRIKAFGYAGAQLDPNNLYLHYSIDGGPEFTEPMISLGNDLFAGNLPDPECGQSVTYYASAEDTQDNVYYYPDPAQACYAFTAGDIDVRFDDDFEENLGWTISGDATAGFWERSLAERHWPFIEDYDGSGICYMTSVQNMADVDNGSTILTSPEINISGGEAFAEFAFYYTNDMGNNPDEDVFGIYFYAGLDIHIVESVGPVVPDPLVWQYRFLKLSDHLPPSQTVKFCFVARDDYGDSHIEAGVDAVRLTVYSFEPHIVTETLPEGVPGEEYLYGIEAASCSPLTWTDRDGDLAGTGLTLSTDGLLSGNPSDSMTIRFYALAEDTTGQTDEKRFTLDIQYEYFCGDVNNDIRVNVGDAVYTINYIFKGGPAPDPLCLGDTNGDDDVNVGDAVYLINYVFNAGPGPIMTCCY